MHGRNDLELEGLGLVLFKLLDDVRVGVIFEDLVDPLGVEGHIDEDAGLVGPSTASAMNAHSHNHPYLAILAHERAAVIPLQDKEMAYFSLRRWLCYRGWIYNNGRMETKCFVKPLMGDANTCLCEHGKLSSEARNHKGEALLSDEIQ